MIRKRRFHASNTPFLFPWMVSHSFLVIIPIVWVNKRRSSTNSSSLFRTSQMAIGVCHQLSFLLSHLRNSHGAEFQDQSNSTNLIWAILRICPKSIRKSFIPNYHYGSHRSIGQNNTLINDTMLLYSNGSFKSGFAFR